MKNDSDDHPEGQTRPLITKNHFAFITFEVNYRLFLFVELVCCVTAFVATQDFLLL